MHAGRRREGVHGVDLDVGIPSGITFADKRFIVDVDLGTSIGMVRFGGAGGLPDSHMFRVLKGKIRYVHTITVCTQPNCVAPLPTAHTATPAMP